jgi:hypothetical protein
VEPLTSAEVVQRLAADTGRSPEVASAMVRDYLDETSAGLGFSVHRWGLDAGDVEEIRRSYEWIDYERGETPGEARDRAAAYAAGWADLSAVADHDEIPGYAAHADQQAARWAERAQGFEPALDELARAREAVAATHQPEPLAQHLDEVADADADGWSS